MIKRKKYILFGFILTAFILTMFIGGILIIVTQNSPDVKIFHVSDYQSCIEEFPSEETLGRISDVEDATRKAETVWIKIYGERVKNEKPYQIFYDKQNKIWLIHGSLPPNMMGGVAYILIENDTGKVLAVWHEK